MIGFSWNQTTHAIEVYNCTSYDCRVDYRFEDADHVLRNNIAYDNDVVLPGCDDENNTWDLGIDNPGFASINSSDDNFLRPQPESPVVGAGIGVPVSLDHYETLGALPVSGEEATSTEPILVDGETTLWAESATYNAESGFQTEHAGFDGSGYVNFEPNTGGYAQWALDVSSADTYGIEIRYANGGSSDRTANLLVGDAERGIRFPQTGGWTNWETIEGTIDLPEGEVDLAIETIGEDAGNVDRIELWPVDEEQQRIAVDGSTTLSAADAETNPGSKFEDEHAGFDGSGYVNFEPNTGAHARWPLDVAAEDSYDVEIRYANGGSSDRTANLLVGDIERDVRFPQTGEWTNWDTIEGTINLPAGAVDLAIETTGQDAGNVDWIALRPAQEDDGETGDGTDGSDGTDGGRSEPDGDTPNHGYNVPGQGDPDWHVPLNENFEAIDRGVPIVDTESAKDQYTAAKRSLYVAVDTGTLYVGDGSEWTELGTLN